MILALSSHVPPAVAEADPDAKPLAPPDTSSPRATLRSFLDNVEAAFRPFYLRESAVYPFQTPAGQRALLTLDDSALPPALARRSAHEAVLLLAEVLGRVELPPDEDVPDAEAMAALGEGVRRDWRIPDTAIEIARVTEGPREGEYLFSAETVLSARDFYERARSLPYRPGAMVGLYERAIYVPGKLFPEGFTHALPRWARRPVGGQAVWQWLGLAAGVTVWLAISVALVSMARGRKRESRYWWGLLFTLALLPLTVALRHYLDDGIKLVGAPFAVIDTALVLFSFLIGAAASVAFGSAVGESIISSPRIDPRSIDAHLIRLIARALAWLTAAGFLLAGASDIGIPLTALVTSVGVGGLAFALAARPTLENLVAGVTLFIDRPVRVGTFCAFEGVIGQVEEIGIRSTKVRRWGGNRITIPNAQFAELRLDNYDDTSNLWIRATLGLRYETTPDQLRFVLARIRELLVGHPRLTGTPRARLAGFGDYSLNVEVLTYADTGNWTEWHAIREDVFLRIMDIVKEAGTSFAFPSQTTYLARDPGLDDALGERAEAEVRGWRESDALPFPDMTDERVESLRGSVDFPPAGSVTRRRTGASPSPPEES